ncbi:hypothetical protein Glove_151g54 [Diversispora epigaea]|uniref:Protein kinase domain-containing protein n=1 Tax=Diversispora epigaea TaxID=1348612 RepID=A0A397IT21_9GLOM|nr:hypothetical protein Glove_151g54 [Diversispora epigaea]
MSDKICKECNHEFTFTNTSGNTTVDKLIQDAQLNANSYYEVIEWIPYHRFEDIKEIAKGGLGTIYKAKWIDGRIARWDVEKKQWKRDGQDYVVLKKFDNNFASLNEDYLNEHFSITNFRFWSKLIGQNAKNLEKRNFWGFAPYYDIPHDKDLARISKFPMNYKTHPEAIYTSRLLNYSSLPKPKNDENFENELEELTKSIDNILVYSIFL